MKPSKLLSSMAISITTVFVILAQTAFYTYNAIVLFQYLGAGFSIELLIGLLPLLTAISTVFIIILGFVGAHKAKNNPTGKGIFVGVAVFQMIALLSMLAVGGYGIYQIIASGAFAPLALVLDGVYAIPYVLGGFALFIAFIKNCAGMKREKVENQDYVAQTRPVPPPPPVPPMYNNQ